VLFLLFFLSGLSGLIYQVVWVREFSNLVRRDHPHRIACRRHLHARSGCRGYVVGLWADRRYARAPDSLLRAYGIFELVIAALGLA